MTPREVDALRPAEYEAMRRYASSAQQEERRQARRAARGR
jgi:hypothetical protein